MELTAFTSRLGVGQGRVERGGSGSGAFAFVLGDEEPGRLFDLSPGDHAEVVQRADLSEVDLVRVQLVLQVPEGLGAWGVWEASLRVDGEKRAMATAEAGRTRRLGDLAANVSSLSGEHEVGVRLELVEGEPGARQLPALVVEHVVGLAVGRTLAVVNRDPSPAQEDVPRGSAVALEVIDTGPEGVARAATRVWIQGVLAFDGAAAEPFKPGFDGPRARVTMGPGALRIVVDPTAGFESQQRVEVRVASGTAGAAARIEEAYTFVAEDRTAPRTLAAQATGPRTVVVAFDEPVLASDPRAVSFVPLDVPAVPLRARAVEARGTMVYLELDTEMTPDVRYRVLADGVTDLHGNAVDARFGEVLFTGFRPARPVGRHFDLWQMLPKHNRRDDRSGDLRRLIACFQELVDLRLSEIDRFVDLFDLERAPEPFVDAILVDLGNPLRLELDALGKRRLASVLVEMYRQKGTAVGIGNAIRFFCGIEVEAISAFAGTALVLGESELGVDWELGPSDRFARYAFDVKVGVVLTQEQRRHVRAIVEYLKPAHTHLVDLIEPRAPEVFDHWELGVSELGVSTDLH